MQAWVLFALLALGSSSALAQWQLSVSEDKMSGGKIVLSTVGSSDSLEMAPPYAGHNPGSLAVRQHPKHGLDVIFRIAKGQITCPFNETCQLAFKFDDTPPKLFAVTKAADHSRDVVFLSNPRPFIASARKAQRILVQAVYYQAGSQVLTFNTPGGLSWK